MRLGVKRLAFGVIVGVIVLVTLAATSGPSPCSSEREHSIELMRFARYSHQYWIDEIEAGRAEVGTDGFGVDWHRWWGESYAGVLADLTSDCAPTGDYPPLADLPGEWVRYGYPARSSVAGGE